jgi:hypothetical protein
MKAPAANRLAILVLGAAMMVPIFAAPALRGASHPAATASRLPADPGRFWIWADRAEARTWQRAHPGLCITKVPDGFATNRCTGTRR